MLSGGRKPTLIRERILLVIDPCVQVSRHNSTVRAPR